MLFRSVSGEGDKFADFIALVDLAEAEGQSSFQYAKNHVNDHDSDQSGEALLEDRKRNGVVQEFVHQVTVIPSCRRRTADFDSMLMMRSACHFAQ